MDEKSDARIDKLKEFIRYQLLEDRYGNPNHELSCRAHPSNGFYQSCNLGCQTRYERMMRELNKI